MCSWLLHSRLHRPPSMFREEILVVPKLEPLPTKSNWISGSLCLRPLSCPTTQALQLKKTRMRSMYLYSYSSLRLGTVNVIATCTNSAYQRTFWRWAILFLGQCWHNAWCSLHISSLVFVPEEPCANVVPSDQSLSSSQWSLLEPSCSRPQRQHDLLRT